MAGTRPVAIGRDPLIDLRRLSDGKRLACAACGAPVVLRAGAVVAPHFAHLPGAVCAHPQGEPETDEHRAGKARIAAWLARCLPDATVTLEAAVAETGQRADLLVDTAAGRIAIEFQCANLDAREWRRRHFQYEGASIRALWILGGSRLDFAAGVLRARELEIALLRAGAPLVYFDPLGNILDEGALARFRPRGIVAGPRQRGTLTVRSLESLPFPWNLLDWPDRAVSAGRSNLVRTYPPPVRTGHCTETDSDERIMVWLRSRYSVTLETLPACLGVPLRSSEIFGCSAVVWQAALYYRFIEGRVGQLWCADEVETWVRRYLPLDLPASAMLRGLLCKYEAYLAAAGFLSARQRDGSARIEADLQTLAQPPDPAAAFRLMEYRRSLTWSKE